MLDGTKVNFFNGTSIREYKACLIPTKKLRFRIIGDSIEVKSGGWEGCSHFEPEYETDISVTYNKKDNSFHYKHEWWDSGDEDSWGSWQINIFSLSIDQINKGVFYIEGQEPPTEMILSFFKSCKNYTTIVSVQPYWKQDDIFSKADHFYDYYVSTNSPVASGTFVKLPGNSFGVVVDNPSKKISLAVNSVNGYKYRYKEATLVTSQDDINYYNSLLEQVENTKEYLEAKESVNEFIDIIFKDYDGNQIYPNDCHKTTNLVVRLDGNHYMIATAFSEEVTINLFKHLNLAYRLKTKLYNNVTRVYNYVNAKSFYNTLSKFEFFEAFEHAVKVKMHCNKNMTLFKINEEPIVIYPIN